MDELLAAIVTWLSLGFGLPADHRYPAIELASPALMRAVQSGDGASRAAARGRHALRRPQREVHALYDDASETIYLPDGWTGGTSAEVSMLVHEMVHHLQKRAGLKYECPQAREALAYEAQERWLARSGRHLVNEFHLDRVTVLLRTRCMH